MATLTTHPLKTSAIQILRLKFATIWTRMRHPLNKDPAPFRDPRLAENLRISARADVDRLLRHAR